MKASKKRIHISLPGDLSEALEALADLEGRTVSDVLAELGRGLLKERGFTPIVDGDKIAAEVERRRKKTK